MITVTEEAKKYVLEQSPKEGASLSLLIRELEYNSWCGPRRVVQVELVEGEPKSNRFDDITPQGEVIKVFAEKDLKSKIKGKKVDLIGWSYYKRLALLG